MAAITSLKKPTSIIQKLSDASAKSKDELARKLFRNLGDLKQYRVTKNYVLVGLYIGGETHAGTHIIRVSLKEDTHQSNCGVVIKLGPSAFKQADGSSELDAPAQGDWVWYRGGYQRMQINEMDYAFLHEDDIVGAIPDPAAITHKL